MLYYMSTDNETIAVNVDDNESLVKAMRFKAEHIKAKADPEIFEAVADTLETLNAIYKEIFDV